MNNEQMEHEIHEVVSECLDRDNVGRLKTELANLCTRVDTEARQAQREADAKICEQHEANQAAHGEHALAEQSRQDAAAIRSNGEQPK